jgi:hypothetical protein
MFEDDDYEYLIEDIMSIVERSRNKVTTGLPEPINKQGLRAAMSS